MITGSRYALVKKSELTEAMLNRSLCLRREDLPLRTSRTYLMWIFPTTTEFYVVEFDPNTTDLFDHLQWFIAEDLLEVQAAEDVARPVPSKLDPPGQP